MTRGPFSGRRHRPFILAVLTGLLAVVPAAAQDAPPVGLATAERAAVVERVPLTGTVTSPRVARISTSVGGLVEAMAVDEGDRVDAGSMLARLDTELERLALKRTEAAVDEARAEHAEARRRLRLARRLREGGSAALSEDELEARRSQVRIATARLAQLEADRDHQAERIDRHILTAPFAGVVARKLTEAGEWVDPGTALVELVAMEGLRIDARVPQQFYSRITPETELRLTLDALPGRALVARIGDLVPVSDPTARTFTLQIHPERGDLPLTPGMSARVVLRLATGERDVVVPRDALIRYPDGRTTVWILQKAEGSATVTERRIETGLAFDGRLQVLDGLEAGTRVVVRGNEALTEGQAVRVKQSP